MKNSGTKFDIPEDTNRKSCRISLALNMVIRDLGAAEITIIGVRETLFPPLKIKETVELKSKKTGSSFAGVQ